MAGVTAPGRIGIGGGSTAQRITLRQTTSLGVTAFRLLDLRQHQPKAALATAAAEAETDPGRALRLAKQAWQDDPSLAPATLAYASRLRAAGREARALAAIRHTWAIAPHPDLADFALAPVSDPLQRPGSGTVQCNGQQPNPCVYTPNVLPTALYDVRSGKVVGPDGVAYSVENSSNIGEDGWKEMLAPAR